MAIDTEKSGQGMNSVKSAAKWLNELRLAKREDEKWLKRGKKIVKRYRDERSSVYDGSKKYNILWSNIQTLMPALYAKTPKAQVQRRWKDQDPVGRTASTILERALQYEIDHYGDFENATRSAVLDRLLPGRGTVWVRFDTKSVETIESAEMEAAEEKEEYEGEKEEFVEKEPLVEMYDGEVEINVETTPVDYVYWEDFRCSPARSWDEVNWVARRVYMTRAEIEDRFGEDVAKAVPLTHEPIGFDEMKNQGASQSDMDSLKKAQIWEIWCKSSESVYWVAEGFDRMLDYKKDPYGLDGFWPCPKPLYATQTTDTLVPVPDYVLYQDQAQEIDDLTKRIGLLVEAVKVVGVYDASQPSIQRMLTEGVDNQLIPVDTWAAFSEKGGIKGTVDFMPLDQVIQALNQCYAAREQAKQVVYDVTGLSDIIRGSSMASETATAQQIKGQYASMRLKSMQHGVSVFVSEVLRIKAQLMADLYSPESLINMSGIMGTPDAQYAEQAIQLLKTEPLRNFRIEVAADSLAEMDEMAEKQSRTEFLTAFGSSMRDALPIIQQVPEMAPMIGEVLTFVVRTFKGGQQLENTLESTIEKMNAPKEPQGPSPEQQQMEAQMQAEQAKMQATMQADAAKIQLEQQKAMLEQEKAQLQHQLEQERLALEKWRVEYENNIKLAIAEMQSNTNVKTKAMDINASKDNSAIVLDDQGNEVPSELLANFAGGLQNSMANMIADTLNKVMEVQQASHAALIDQMNKPKKRVIQRDANGKAVAAIEVIE